MEKKPLCYIIGCKFDPDKKQAIQFAMEMYLNGDPWGAVIAIRRGLKTLCLRCRCTYKGWTKDDEMDALDVALNADDE